MITHAEKVKLLKHFRNKLLTLTELLKGQCTKNQSEAKIDFFKMCCSETHHYMSESSTSMLKTSKPSSISFCTLSMVKLSRWLSASAWNITNIRQFGTCMNRQNWDFFISVFFHRCHFFNSLSHFLPFFPVTLASVKTVTTFTVDMMSSCLGAFPHSWLSW